MKLVIVICAIVFIGSALTLWALCAMAGECSREEEKRDEEKTALEATGRKVHGEEKQC